MKTSRFSEPQILANLWQAEGGVSRQIVDGFNSVDLPLLDAAQRKRCSAPTYGPSGCLFVADARLEGEVGAAGARDLVESATLMVAPMVEQVTAAEPVTSAGPELVVGSVIIRLEPGASASRIASVARALMAAS